MIEQVEKILKSKNFEVELLNLYDYEIKYCLGCEHCILNGNCILNDGVNIIFEKIKNSDAFILATPVYIENVSGILKTFFD